MKFDEKSLILEQQKHNIKKFLIDMKRIDREHGRILEKQGWVYRETADRTVTFTFGEVTLIRRCYEKGGIRCYPVDDYLSLDPYSRFSKWLLYKIASTAVDLTCRKAASHFQELLNVNITKDTVHKARKIATELYKEKEEYQLISDEEVIEKAKVDILYIEGDGLLISTPDAENDIKKTDYAHFLIHEGIEREYGSRGKAINKHEIWSNSNKKAREQVLDYIYNHYEIKKDTLIISNSDMGHGYTPYVFEEIANTFNCRHEHFWDRYHLNKKISDMTKNFPSNMEEKIFNAVAEHDRKKLIVILDTMESRIEINDNELAEKFIKFKRKLLNNFPYTKLPEMRGLSPVGIGIMEGNHTKISYRLKKQARYWSKDGALTMGNMIIDKAEGVLNELFFGDWREMYQKHKNLENRSVNKFLKKSNRTAKGVPHVRHANKYGKRTH